MFNFIVAGLPESWDSSPYEMDKSRVAIEYTANEISERYKDLNEKAIKELISFPCLFVIENEQRDTKIGYITGIRLRQTKVVLEFQVDPILPVLPRGTIGQLRTAFDLGKWELSRTHWAVKDEPLFEILINQGYINKEQLNASLALKNPTLPPPPPPPIPDKQIIFNTSQVFIVHGHDEIAKLEMADFINSLGLEAIILHMQANSGLTIIEKIERYSNVGFGVILYTPCDVGAKAGSLNGKYRARQNVVFEHGYLIGKLGRSRVAAVVKNEVETPTDINGIVYIPMDDNGKWKKDLIKELIIVGYSIKCT